MPNEFGLDRWLIDYQEAGRSAGLRPIHDATRAIAMLSFPAPDFDIDYRDVEAQKRLLREQMAGFGWETQRILAHLDDTPDFYLDQVAQVVMDRWSSGRVGLLGDAAFSASPMSGAGTGLALVGAYMLAGELAAADWDPEAGFAGYEERMRDYVEANQEIGRMHVQMLAAPDPDAEPSPEPDMEALTALIERAVNGPELPDYEGVPDSGTTHPAPESLTSSALGLGTPTTRTSGRKRARAARPSGRPRLWSRLRMPAQSRSCATCGFAAYGACTRASERGIAGATVCRVRGLAGRCPDACRPVGHGQGRDHGQRRGVAADNGCAVVRGDDRSLDQSRMVD